LNRNVDSRTAAKAEIYSGFKNAQDKLIGINEQQNFIRR
jgi:hypothetical protein